MRIADHLCTKKRSKTIPTFLKKTYDILEESDNNFCVRWAPNDVGFIVIDEDAFSKKVLPKFFKHSNYSSFVRQLNMYNFHKIRQGGSESYFHHELFVRSNIEKIADIKRKPQKKRRKYEQQEQSEKQLQLDFPRARKSLKIPRSYKKSSLQSITQKKKQQRGQNTRDAFHSQQDNHEGQDARPPSQNIFSIQAEDDRISIDGGILDAPINTRQLICTRQLIYPSNQNMHINYNVPVSNPSLNLV